MTDSRTYRTTHPWLTFQLDLTRAPFELWMLLGECQSKCEHLAGVPLLPATARKLAEVYLAKGVQATTAIEGNTLTEDAILERIKRPGSAPPSQSYLQREVDNVIDACNAIGKRILSPTTALAVSPSEIKEFNRMVLAGLPLEDGAVAGEIPQFAVTVGRYRGAPRADCDHLLNELCAWLDGPAFRPVGELRIGMAILRAVIAHLYIAWIHPFADGNGRTARLIEFRILLASGVPAPAAHLLSNHYNKSRAEYYRQLDAASQRGGDPLPFIRYAVEGFRDGLVEQLARIRSQQLRVMWINYIHEKFRNRRTPADKRRRDLALAMPFGREVARGDVTRLTPDLAADYARRGARTLARDLNELVVMGLLIRGPSDTYRVARQKIQAFLPRRRQGPPSTPPPSGT